MSCLHQQKLLRIEAYSFNLKLNKCLRDSAINFTERT